ncbi:MAG: sigma-70 family RNA polymerase sigma factor [Bacteroidota bacterium]
MAIAGNPFSKVSVILIIPGKAPFMVEEELRLLIRNCIQNDRRCQQALYKTFYGYAMGICLRYTNNRDEAVEVLNKGFFKVFAHLDRFDPERPFKSWLGRIMMNVSIDHYRANLKMAYFQDLEEARYVSESNLSDSHLNYNDLIAMVQQLPPAYRTVFNLFAIDGYSHEEIAELLQINVGTSKSNLHKARKKLRQMIYLAEESTRVTYRYSTRGSNLVICDHNLLHKDQEQ